MTILCSVYASTRREGMYVYMRKTDDLETLPEGLKKLFGRPRPAMMLMLDGKKPLARANVDDVISAIEAQGYFLQMPEREEGEERKLAEQNSKLSL